MPRKKNSTQGLESGRANQRRGRSGPSAGARQAIEHVMQPDQAALVEQLRSVNEQLALASLRLKESAEESTAVSQMLITLLVTLPVGVIVASKNGEVVLNNPAVEEIFGAPVTGTLYEPDRNYTLCHPDGSPLPGPEYPLRRSIESGEITKGKELLVRRLDGTNRRVLVYSNPVLDPEEKIIAGVAIFQEMMQGVGAERG
ncbi:MAG: PAS domain-containing protein [Chloroflexi bacterium]|nr:PAS domain-containing protein [Chloroflexota bacterium]